MKLYKIRKRGKLLGVCAGISDSYGIDVTKVRIIAVLLYFIFGSGLLIYLLLGIFLPEKSKVN